MQRWVLIYCFVPVIGINLFAQTVTTDRLHHHFGILNERSEYFTDFVFTNRTGKKVYLLRVAADKDISYRISNTALLPDSSVTLRIQYNARETGKFSRQIEAHLSCYDQPVSLSISGEVNELPHTGLLADCPDFSRVKDISREMEFALKIKVVDKLSGVPVEGAQVKIIYKGLPKYIFETPENGMLQKKIPLGYYYFVTSAEEYITSEFDAFVNVRNNELLIELAPVITIHPDPVEEYEKQIFSENNDTIIEKDAALTFTMTDSIKPGSDQQSNDTSVFSNEKYAQNNLVFLIDVSSSMMHDGKLDLLKASMIELAKMLRSEDRIGIVVYSTHARVALSPVGGDRKEEVIKMIQEMEGDGLTAGSEGMKKAYELAISNFIGGGNNMVIMATDGAFNLYTTDVMPMVKKYAKKGINTTVIGIKNTERDASNMKSIAGEGRGRYLAINNLEEAETTLTEEIKTASQRE